MNISENKIGTRWRPAFDAIEIRVHNPQMTQEAVVVQNSNNIADVDLTLGNDDLARFFQNKSLREQPVVSAFND